MIKVSYVNFWCDPTNDRYLSNFISKNIEEVIEVHPLNDPDVIFFSCFGDINLAKKLKSKCKIFYYGENPNRYKPYNNFDKLKQYFDLIIGFRPSYNDSSVIRFPLWLMYYNTHNINDSNNIVDHIEREYFKNKSINKKYFATIVAKKSSTKPSRNIIYQEMSKYGDVIAPKGLIFGNENIERPKNVSQKINFIKNSLYNICPENSSYPGYYTEKVFQALEAGTIPVYWGINNPEPNIINENKYCFADINNQDRLTSSITNSINNPKKHTEKKVFKARAKESIQVMYDNLKKSILNNIQ